MDFPPSRARGILELLLSFVRLIEELEKPKSVRFVTIKTRNLQTKEWIIMTQSLVNDAISNIPLEFDNLIGQKVAVPAGGTVTISVLNTPDNGSPSTAATAALGADGSSVDVTPTP